MPSQVVQSAGASSLRAAVCLLSLSLGACSGEGPAANASGAGGAGTAGSQGSAGGGAGGVTDGGAGSGATNVGGVGGTGTLGAAGTGAGGVSAAGGSSGTAGSGSPTAGAGGGDSPDGGGQVAGTSGSSDASGSGGSGGAHPAKVLIYAIATAFDHASIPAAATAIAKAASGAGLTVDIVPANVTTSNNKVPVPGDFTPEALSAYGAVVLLGTSGEPFGAPGTPQIKALADFVTAGGGLVAISNATHAYDSSTPDPSPTYISLLGADFNGQTPYGSGTCTPVGTHPSVSTLPASFDINDEVYNFKNINPDIQVVLECKNTPTAAPRPVSWVRTQGAGRVFFTALGKQDHSWLPPELLVPNHVLPGLLWTMRR
jgi:type 1 glutamine amidotransferase